MKSMTRISPILLVLPCLAMGSPRGDGDRGVPRAFEVLALHLEVDLPANPSLAAASDAALLDLPAEIVLELQADAPLRSLRVVAPDGKTVLGARYARGGGTSGVEIAIESEAESLRALLEEFPEGRYDVLGLGWDGSSFHGEVDLEARFPGAFAAGLAGGPVPVPADAAELTWSSSAGAAGYELEVECEELGTEFSVMLPAAANGFAIPAALLAPGHAYEFSLAVKGDTDNELEFEGTFATSP